MAKPLELGPELTEVVNLPVERQHELAGAIDHGLMPRCRKIDDCQTPIA